MSETGDSETPEPVSMTKKARPAPAAARKVQVDDLPMPGTIKATMVALGLVAIGSIGRGLSVVLASPNSFRAYEINLNHHAKKPKKNYGIPGDHQITNDIHALRSSYLVYAVISALIVVFLIWGLRKARSASGSRWVMIFALFLTGALGGLVPPHGFPGPAQVLGVVVGVAALLSLGLVFSPPSTAYARACREASLPEALRGQPRPKLFGPRPTPAARQGAARSTAGRPAGGRPAAERAARPASAAGSRAKAKARSDSEAVARGAELARSRARAASKSRRTDA